MKKLAEIPLFTWELLQNILGLIVIGWNKLINNGCTREKFDGISYYKVNNLYNSGVSLGRFIILDKVYCQEKYKTGENPLLGLTVHHEDGHRKQSRMLGPLYLFAVGVPSAIHNIYNRRLKSKMTESERMTEYYEWYCEKWADKLGGITEKRKQYIEEIAVYGTSNKHSGN